jgi:hypothetical protein
VGLLERKRGEGHQITSTLIVEKREREGIDWMMESG